MKPETSPTVLLLRLIAFPGTGVILIWQAVAMPAIQPRQSAGFAILGLAVVTVGLTLRMFLPDATHRLFRNADLLVPLGLFVTLSTIFSALAALPVVATMLAASWPITILTLSFSLSVSFVVISLLSIVFVAWTTMLIFQIVLLGHVNLVTGFRIVRRWFWRVLALELFGWGILFAISGVVLTTGIASMAFALPLLGVAALLWNLATAAVLPVALADTQSLGPALRHGLEVSRVGMRRWAPLIIIQMVLLGWVTFIDVSYTTSETKHDGTKYTETNTITHKTNWGVNSFWTGGYPDGGKWHESLMKALEASPLELIDRWLSLLFAILAIAIKIKIIGDIYGPAPTYETEYHYSQRWLA